MRMKKQMTTRKNVRTKGVVALLLVLVMSVTLLPASFQAAGSEITTTQTMYSWTRVTDQDQLLRVLGDQRWHPVLLAMRDGGNVYLCPDFNTITTRTDFDDCERKACVMGMDYPSGAEYPSFDQNSTPLRLLGGASRNFIRYTGSRDGDNDGAPLCEFGWSESYGSSSPTWYLCADDDHVAWGWSTSAKDECRWTIYGYQGDPKMGDYSSYADTMVPWLFKIFYNCSGSDVTFYYSGGYIMGTEWGSYDNYSQFALYVGSSYQVSVIQDDYTVAQGTVFNMDDEVILAQNATLTVEPGAVLSVNGRFYCNGTIHNYGTVILQEGASVTRFAPNHSQSYGEIICDGGEYDLSQSVKTQIEQTKAALQSAKATIQEQKDKKTAAESVKDQANKDRTAKLRENGGQLEAELSVVQRELTVYQNQVKTLQAEIDGLEEDIRKLTPAGGISAADINTQKVIQSKTQTKSMKEVELKSKRSARDKSQLKYNELYAPIAVYDDAINQAQQEIDEAEELLNSETARQEILEKRLERLEGSMSSFGGKVQGEGVLILLQKSFLALDSYVPSTGRENLIVRDGGNVVCGGYIICGMGGMRLSGSRMRVLSGGAVLLGEYINSDLLNLAKYQPRNLNTLDIQVGSLSKYNATYCNSSINVSGSYSIRVDGVLRYSVPMRSYETEEALIADLPRPTGTKTATATAGVYEGTGVWSTVGAPTGKVTKDGTITEYYAGGNYKKTYQNGTVEVYDAAQKTLTTTTQSDELVTERVLKIDSGETTETIKDRSGNVVSLIYYDSTGVMKSGSYVITNAEGKLDVNGTKQVVNMAANGFLTVTDETPAAYTYTLRMMDGSRKTFARTAEGITGAVYTADDQELYKYRVAAADITNGDLNSFSWSKEIHIYADHQEEVLGGLGVYTVGSGKRITSATYSSGDYQNASYVCQPDYYNRSSWRTGQLLWQVQAKNGISIFTCRAAGTGSEDQVVYSGSSDDLYSKALSYTQGMGGEPYPAKFLNGTTETFQSGSLYSLPILESADGGWTEDDIYQVPYTDGTTGKYLDEQCTLQAEAEFTYGDYAGASILYSKWYIEDITWDSKKDCPVPDNVLIWRVTAANGEVTECRAINRGEADPVGKVQNKEWKLVLASRTGEGQRIFTNWSESSYATMPDPMDFLLTSDVPDTDKYRCENARFTFDYEGKTYAAVESFGTDGSDGRVYTLTKEGTTEVWYKATDRAAAEKGAIDSSHPGVYTFQKAGFTAFGPEVTRTADNVNVYLAANSSNKIDAFYRVGKATAVSGTTVSPGYYTFSGYELLYIDKTRVTENAVSRYDDENSSVSYYTYDDGTTVKLYRHTGEDFRLKNSYTEANTLAAGIWRFGSEARLYFLTPADQKKAGFGIFEYADGVYSFKNGTFRIGEKGADEYYTFSGTTDRYRNLGDGTYSYGTASGNEKVYTMGTETEVTG